MGADKVYRDFTLCEISHQTLESFPANLLGGKKPQQIIRQKFLFGKNIIDSETKPGDLLLIGFPIRVTSKDVKNYSDNIKDAELDWKISRYDLNLYYALATYTKKKGRRVESLEPSSIAPQSKLMKAYFRPSKLPQEEANRVKWLVETKRNYIFQKRIQKRKPRLVITARSHAVFLEDKMKPKKVIYESPVPVGKGKSLLEKELYRMVKATELQRIAEETKKYLQRKKERRLKAIKEKGLKMKRGWKPKA